MIYIYELEDFINGLNEARLHDEVVNSNITVALSTISREISNVSIVFKNTLSTSEETLLNDLVNNHIGTPLENLAFNELGQQIVAPTFLHVSQKARLQGFPMEIEPDTVGILDIEVTTQLLVQGGQFWVQNSEAGDQVSFSVVDKNNILGLHTLYSLPLGTPLELVRYVKDYQLPTATIWQDNIDMPTVADVAQGLFLRVIYEAIPSGVNRKTGILFRWYVEE